MPRKKLPTDSTTLNELGLTAACTLAVEICEEEADSDEFLDLFVETKPDPMGNCSKVWIYYTVPRSSHMHMQEIVPPRVYSFLGMYIYALL